MITIYGELQSGKNSRKSFYNPRSGKMSSYKPKNAKLAEEDLIKQLTLKKREWDNEIIRFRKTYPEIFLNPYDEVYPMKISFKIYRKTHRRFDYINILQDLCDCMVKAGWIEDDDAKHLIPHFEQYELDKSNPRVEIKILL
jgi:Holliday junction resolvase RusA-like endonuclease